MTSPLDPELITEAETVSEAFENARDALKALRVARTKLASRGVYPRAPEHASG